MDILIGILLVIFLLIGFGLGLTIPFIIRKYFDIFSTYKNEIETLKEKIKDNEEKSDNNFSVIQDNKIINEWLNGGEESEE